MMMRPALKCLQAYDLNDSAVKAGPAGKAGTAGKTSQPAQVASWQQCNLSLTEATAHAALGPTQTTHNITDHTRSTAMLQTGE